MRKFVWTILPGVMLFLLTSCGGSLYKNAETEKFVLRLPLCAPADHQIKTLEYIYEIKAPLNDTYQLAIRLNHEKCLSLEYSGKRTDSFLYRDGIAYHRAAADKEWQELTKPEAVGRLRFLYDVLYSGHVYTAKQMELQPEPVKGYGGKQVRTLRIVPRDEYHRNPYLLYLDEEKHMPAGTAGTDGLFTALLYDRMEIRDGVAVAEKITFQPGRSGGTIRMELKNIRLNKAFKPETFEIPEKQIKSLK